MLHQAIGKAMTAAMTTNRIYSLESIKTIPCTEAPSTFRTPISFVRLSAVYAARPNSPRLGDQDGQERKYSKDGSHSLISVVEDLKVSIQKIRFEGGGRRKGLPFVLERSQDVCDVTALNGRNYIRRPCRIVF